MDTGYAGGGVRDTVCHCMSRYETLLGESGGVWACARVWADHEGLSELVFVEWQTHPHPKLHKASQTSCPLFPLYFIYHCTATTLLADSPARHPASQAAPSQHFAYLQLCYLVHCLAHCLLAGRHSVDIHIIAQWGATWLPSLPDELPSGSQLPQNWGSVSTK